MGSERLVLLKPGLLMSCYPARRCQLLCSKDSVVSVEKT